MRWWFLIAVSLAITSGTYCAYRFRLQQLLELERVRTRIASDLHDDIGSSLTQIAIMSEVARRQNGHQNGHPLERIADLSRELVDSMSDIVWAINPKRDQLSDLIQRIHSDWGLLVMADVDAIDTGIRARDAGADLVATTLSGYTEQTAHVHRDGPDLQRGFRGERERRQLRIDQRDRDHGFRDCHG